MKWTRAVQTHMQGSTVPAHRPGLLKEVSSRSPESVTMRSVGVEAHLHFCQDQTTAEDDNVPEALGTSSPFQFRHSSALTGNWWYMDLVHYSSTVSLSVNLSGLQLLWSLTTTVFYSRSQGRPGFEHEQGGPKLRGCSWEARSGTSNSDRGMSVEAEASHTSTPS